MSRSAAEFWWKIKVPPEIHHYWRNHPHEEWNVVTWEDIFAKRTERIRARTEYKRMHDVTKPCYVWVFNNGKNFPHGGYWLYIKTLRGDFALTFRYKVPHLVRKVMELFPCGMQPDENNVQQWMEAFAKRYPHNGFGRKGNGLALAKCVLNERGDVLDVMAHNFFDLSHSGFSTNLHKF